MHVSWPITQPPGFASLQDAFVLCNGNTGKGTGSASPPPGAAAGAAAGQGRRHRRAAAVAAAAAARQWHRPRQLQQQATARSNAAKHGTAGAAGTAGSAAQRNAPSVRIIVSPSPSSSALCLTLAPASSAAEGMSSSYCGAASERGEVGSKQRHAADTNTERAADVHCRTANRPAECGM